MSEENLVESRSTRCRPGAGIAPTPRGPRFGTRSANWLRNAEEMCSGTTSPRCGKSGREALDHSREIIGPGDEPGTAKIGVRRGSTAGELGEPHIDTLAAFRASLARNPARRERGIGTPNPGICSVAAQSGPNRL